MLLLHHLAMESGRTYVYQPITWKYRHDEELPTSTFLPGVVTGSIDESTFEKVCPPNEVVRITGLLTEYGSRWSHALEILQREDKCVVVADWILDWG